MRIVIFLIFFFNNVLNFQKDGYFDFAKTVILNNKVLSCSVFFSCVASCFFQHMLMVERGGIIQEIFEDHDDQHEEFLNEVTDNKKIKVYNFFLKKFLYGYSNKIYILKENFKIYKKNLSIEDDLYQGILCLDLSLFDLYIYLSNKYSKVRGSFCLLFKILEYNRCCIKIPWYVIMVMLCLSGIVKNITSLQDKNLDKWWNLSIFKFNVIFSILLIFFAVYKQYNI
jgi:hypothetical protein